jgi:hypothetical protein
LCESGRWSIKLWSPEVCKLAETSHFKGTLSAIKGPNRRERVHRQLSSRNQNAVKETALLN